MVDQEIQRYQKTLASIPEDRHDMIAIVSYNIGLAHLQAKQPNEALESLRIAAEISESRVKEKALNLYHRVKNAVRKGSSLRVKEFVEVVESRDDNHMESPEEAEEIQQSMILRESISHHLTINAGEMACFKIFRASQLDPRCSRMLQEIPRINFKARFEYGDYGEPAQVQALKKA